MTIILPVVTGLCCLMSFLLLLKDKDVNWGLQPQDTEGTEKIKDSTRVELVYSAVCITFTVLVAVFFPKVYPENSAWVNIKRMILLSIIWPIAYIDFKTMRIPNLFVIYGLICRAIILVFEIFLGHAYVWRYLLAESIAAGALLLAAVLCALVVQNGIGFGDMKLFVVMGLMLGLDGIWGAVFTSLIVSFFIAVFVLITKKKTRKDAIPFGPALVIGTYLSICLSGM